jgi:hypothetical protein
MEQHPVSAMSYCESFASYEDAKSNFLDLALTRTGIRPATVDARMLSALPSNAPVSSQVHGTSPELGSRSIMFIVKMTVSAHK